MHDELLVAQENPAQLDLCRWQLLHHNNRVFCPSNPDEPTRTTPVSLKNLLKGDACWATQKLLLGWIVDSMQGTLKLPLHRQIRLTTILGEVQGRSQVSVKNWHKFIGKMRRIAL